MQADQRAALHHAQRCRGGALQGGAGAVWGLPPGLQDPGLQVAHEPAGRLCVVAQQEVSVVFFLVLVFFF